MGLYNGKKVLLTINDDKYTIFCSIHLQQSITVESMKETEPTIRVIWGFIYE